MNRKFRRHPVHYSFPRIDFTNEQIPEKVSGKFLIQRDIVVNLIRVQECTNKPSVALLL